MPSQDRTKQNDNSKNVSPRYCVSFWYLRWRVRWLLLLKMTSDFGYSSTYKIHTRLFENEVARVFPKLPIQC